MDRTFIFGGLEYQVVQKILLRGMDYYHVLKNPQTGAILYLYCFPGS